MNRQSTAHLDYDQLLQALVDTDDLGDGARAHLEACTGCQHQIKRLVQRYDRLGQMAKKMAPAPAEAFRVPERRAMQTRRHFRPVFAMGVVAAMIMMFTIWGPRLLESPGLPEQIVAQNSLSDDPLMDGIDDLVANALPVAYQELAAVSDPESVEDLIEWIVPSIEEGDDLDPRA